MLGMGRDQGIELSNSNYMLGGSLVSHILTRWPGNFSVLTKPELVSWLVTDITTLLGDYSKAPRPGFMQAMALSWSYGPSEIKAVVAALPEWVQVVSIERFRQLFEATART